MKDRPLLIVAIAFAIVAWILFKELGGVSGITQRPLESLATAGFFLAIVAIVFWFRYRELKRQPSYVALQDADASPSNPLLLTTPIILKASAGKVILLAAIAAAGIVAIALSTGVQPGLCGAIAATGLAPPAIAVLVFVLASLLRPETLELSPLGLTHHTSWREYHWSWNEVRNITLIKGQNLAFVSALTFDIYGAADPSHPSRHMLRPIWRIALPELANLLNDARVHWSSHNAALMTPPPKQYVVLALSFAWVGLYLWLILARPCG